MQSKAFFVDEALKVELYVTRECVVRTTCIKSPKRVLLEFGNKSNEKIVSESLVLQNSDGKRSAEYSLLCQDFYL
jgi:tRNA1Val (adenine37-N6)-methyltransferase